MRGKNLSLPVVVDASCPYTSVMADADTVREEAMDNLRATESQSKRPSTAGAMLIAMNQGNEEGRARCDGKGGAASNQEDRVRAQ